ncbi:MAG TPA: OB-fold domain-containing protein [Solirubrobacteraceae bacterium]|jgi:uncharacterized protein|nr:OB-fold domain-containing protein [Solirubrobacteraceae bacterium]
MPGPDLQRCEDCGSAILARRLLCPVCGSRRLAVERSCGDGVVYSTTTVHARDGAYNVALVDLAEGVRVMSAVVGVAPDDVRIGMRVRARDDGERIVFHAG